MFSTDFSTNCTPNFIQNTDNWITLGNTSAENQGLECTISYSNIERRFSKHDSNNASKRDGAW